VKGDTLFEHYSIVIKCRTGRQGNLIEKWQ